MAVVNHSTLLRQQAMPDPRALHDQLALKETYMSPKEWWIPGSCKIKTPDFFQEMDASKLAPVRGYGRRTQRETGIPGTRERLMPGWLMGIAFTKELSGVMVGYLAQGMMTGGYLAIQYFFKDVISIGPVQLASIKSLLALPWLVRPLYGLVSDCTPLFGYHRRSYLVVSGALACTSYVVWALEVTTAEWAASLWVVSTFCTAMTDVILDGVSCEMSRGVPQAQAGALQSLTRLSFAMGALITACLTGYFIDTIGSRIVILIMGSFSLLSCMAGFLISDTPGGGDPLSDPSAYKKLLGQKTLGPAPASAKPTSSDREVKSSMNDPSGQVPRRPRTRMQLILRALWSSVKQKRVLHPLLFICIFMATPQTSNAMFYFYTNSLGFTPGFLAQMAILARGADVASTLIYARFFKSVGMRKLFLWTAVLATILGMSQVVLVTGLNRVLLIPDEWFVFGDTIFIETVSRTALLHLMVLCSNLCPAGCESTMFALIMACASTVYLGLGNLGGSFLMWVFGVTSTNFVNLTYLVAACNILHLLCLPFLALVPRTIDPVASFGIGFFACTVPDSALGFVAEPHQQEQIMYFEMPRVNREQLYRKLRHLERFHHSSNKCAEHSTRIHACGEESRAEETPI